MKGSRNEKGQVLIAAVVLLALLALITPVMLQYARTESQWSTKNQSNMVSHHLSELALEAGYQKLILTTSTWSDLLAGNPVAGFNFDTTYTDPSGGEYQIRLSSGSGSTIYVTGVARGQDKKEIRAVRAQYAGSGYLSNAIYSEGTVTPSGSANVEWGPVMSRTKIQSADSHPRYYSSGEISPLDTNPAVPNTDNIQYWAYSPNVPGLPMVDLNYYRAQAQAAGTTSAACGDSFYKGANFDFRGCIGAGNSIVSGTWYTTGNATFRAGMGGNYMGGVLIALGNMEMNGNGGATVNVVVPLPPEAWKEYGNDWAYYRATWDAAAPATHAAAVTASYQAATNATIPNLLFDGLIYVQGNYQATGAGNASYRGVVIVQAQSDMNASSTLFYKPNLSYRSIDTSIQRTAWIDLKCSWPLAGNASCN